MAQLPPSAVFGAVRPGRAVHVLLLIENSLPMVEHWQDLQRHILPGVLGAVRIANPGVNVQIFWETTGKTQDQRAPHKSQRHFNDFPDIDIVGMPRNRLSPLFIRQSIDLFLLGNNQKLSVTRHLFIVAMSNPIDDFPGKSDSQQHSQVDDAKWEAVVTKLQENDIFLHIIVNPVARLTRVFELYRKTMRYQSRQEVVPWQPVDTSHCICHLSGSIHAANTQDLITEEWPEVRLVSPDSPQPAKNSPLDMSDEELPSPISPIDMINSNPGSLSLVSRMQALHGLANRRRPAEGRRRTSVTRASFFRDTSPVASLRRERLAHGKSSSKEKDRHRQPPGGVGPTLPTASFSSALDLRGLTQEPGLRSPVDENGHGGSSSGAFTTAPAGSPPRMRGLPSSSPGSDASGSTLSSPISTMSTISQRAMDKPPEGDTRQPASAFSGAQTILYPLKFGSSATQPSPSQYFGGPSSPSISVPLRPDPSLPISPILYQTPIVGPLPYGAYAAHPSISSLPAFAQYSSYTGAITGPRAFGRNVGAAGAAVTTPPAMAAVTASGMQLDAIDTDLDVDVVPASAPPDSRGQVPFVFDAAYEAQSAIRLRHAIDSMHEGDGALPTGLESGPGGDWEEQAFLRGRAEYTSSISQEYFSCDRDQLEEMRAGAYSMSSSAEQYV